MNDRIFITGGYTVHADAGNDRIRIVANDLIELAPRNQIEGNRGTDSIIDDSKQISPIDLRRGLPCGSGWLRVSGIENATENTVVRTQSLTRRG